MVCFCLLLQKPKKQNNPKGLSVQKTCVSWRNSSLLIDYFKSTFASLRSFESIFSLTFLVQGCIRNLRKPTTSEVKLMWTLTSRNLMRAKNFHKLTPASNLRWFMADLGFSETKAGYSLSLSLSLSLFLSEAHIDLFTCPVAISNSPFMYLPLWISYVKLIQPNIGSLENESERGRRVVEIVFLCLKTLLRYCSMF